jgi:hypothetical protein
MTYIALSLWSVVGTNQTVAWPLATNHITKIFTAHSLW